jgi:predicted amidohydrolase
MSARKTIRVATAQYPIDQLATMDAARDKIARWVREAASQGAQLVVFPEYGAMELSAIRGLQVAADVPASLEAVSEMLGEIDALHAELARQHRVYILAASGPSRRVDGRYVNVARLMSPTGQFGTQEKLIMTPFERDWGIVGGQHQRVFDTSLGRIGIAICYDSEFPLLVRAQAEAGADLMVIPSCTERVSGAHRVRTAALARALENGCATVVSPTVGDAPWCLTVDHNEGIGGIYVPAEAGVSDAGILAEGRLSKPGWVFAEIDLGALKALRASGEMRNANDWPLQPGAAPLAGSVEIVDLG